MQHMLSSVRIWLPNTPIKPRHFIIFIGLVRGNWFADGLPLLSGFYGCGALRLIKQASEIPANRACKPQADAIRQGQLCASA